MRLSAKGLAVLTVVGGGLLLAACEGADRRLEGLRVGMAKDSVLAVMGTGPDRTDPYLYQGRYIEAMYFRPAGKDKAEILGDRKMSPVVVIDGTLQGWGWAFWDSTAAASHIEVAPDR
ncbi:MAG: hypothetical protein AB7L66_07450 [Gemmatimonadales bacterium]